MNTVNDNWMITSAPPELLLGLVIFALLAGLVLFLLALEEGRYPEFAKAVCKLRAAFDARATKKYWKEVSYVEG